MDMMLQFRVSVLGAVVGLGLKSGVNDFLIGCASFLNTLTAVYTDFETN